VTGLRAAQLAGTIAAIALAACSPAPGASGADAERGPWEAAGLWAGMSREELDAVMLRDFEQSLRCHLPVPAPPACADLRGRVWTDSAIVELTARIDTAGRVVMLTLSGDPKAAAFQHMAWSAIRRWRDASTHAPGAVASDTLARTGDGRWEARTRQDDLSNVESIVLLDRRGLEAFARAREAR
jgi:hypothetical protein